MRAYDLGAGLDSVEVKITSKSGQETTQQAVLGDDPDSGTWYYTFTPVANYNGAVPVATYTLTDGSSSDTSTLTITDLWFGKNWVSPLAAVSVGTAIVSASL